MPHSITALYLSHFRKLSEAHFEFGPGVNALVGPNAQGKTTVLEAIYFLIAGKSFRTHRQGDLFEIGTHRFDIACDFIKGELPARLTVSVEPEGRQVIYRDTRLSTLSALLGLLLGSVMTPDDVHLVKGSPQARREFLDLQIAETDPLYSWHLARYTRAMRQRNALLKAKRLTTCESWEHEMALSAAYLNQSRRKATHALEIHFQQLYSRLQDAHEKVKLDLLTQGEDEAFFRREWSRTREKEMHLGFTTSGPHKDDLEILIQDKPAKHFASEGQKQTLLLALKLAEWRRLYELSEEKPLFLIDDVGLSLDQTRRARLFSEIDTMGQVFLTTTDLKDFPLKDAQIHHLGSS